VVEGVGVGDEARDGGSDAGVDRGDEWVDEFVRDELKTELFDAWREVLESLAFRRLLAECLMFSFHLVVALAHNFTLVRCSFSVSTSCCDPFFFTSFFSKSIFSRCLWFRLQIRKKMKTAMSAASTRENASMRIVRALSLSDILVHPGGSKSVSLGGGGVGVDARSSMG
jgi:hypothetical protein